MMTQDSQNRSLLSIKRTASENVHPLPSTRSGAYVAVLASPVNSAIRIELEPGQYVVGRSAVPIENPSFINLESPRSAISRNHASLVIGKNFDSWIEDNDSTNGTFLAIRDGEGIRLDPRHFYQLSSGALIILGDVELRFTLEPRKDPPPAINPVAHVKNDVLKLDANGELAAAARLAAAIDPSSSSVDLSKADYGCVGAPMSTAKAAPQDNDNAYLDTPMRHNKPPVSTLPSSRIKKEKQKKTETTLGGKRGAEANNEKELEESLLRCKPRRDDTRTFKTAGATIRACLTGFDSRARAKVAKIITSTGGLLEDEWTDECNLLIVKESPAPRTPKLIIAVAQGRDVVTQSYISTGDVTVGEACPAVAVDDETVSSATLRSAILKYRDLGPPLKGRSYFINRIEPKAMRDQLATILQGCGATVVTKPGKQSSGGAVALSLDDINTVYSSIILGNGATK